MKSSFSAVTPTPRPLVKGTLDPLPAGSAPESLPPALPLSPSWGAGAQCMEMGDEGDGR